VLQSEEVWFCRLESGFLVAFMDESYSESSCLGSRMLRGYRVSAVAGIVGLSTTHEVSLLAALSPVLMAWLIPVVTAQPCTCLASRGEDSSGNLDSTRSRQTKSAEPDGALHYFTLESLSHENPEVLRFRADSALEVTAWVQALQKSVHHWHRNGPRR
jgi:hypothetical protein